jgi:hypothetical protein
MKISDPRFYSIIMFLAQVVLPVLGGLYFILGLPETEQVVGAIILIDALLGVLLFISMSQRSSSKVGEIEITELPSGGKTYSLNLVGDPEDIEQYDEVRFAVSKGTTLAKPGDLEALNHTPRQNRRRRQPHA